MVFGVFFYYIDNMKWMNERLLGVWGGIEDMLRSWCCGVLVLVY